MNPEFQEPTDRSIVPPVEAGVSRRTFLMSAAALAGGLVVSRPGFAAGFADSTEPVPPHDAKRVGSETATTVPGDTLPAEPSATYEESDLNLPEAPPIDRREIAPHQVIGSIRIPKLENPLIYEPWVNGDGVVREYGPMPTHDILYGKEHEDLDRGAALSPAYALPGENRTEPVPESVVLIGGHRVTQINGGESVFYALDKLELNDTALIEMSEELGGNKHAYIMTSMETVEDITDGTEVSAKFPVPEPGQRLLVLYACTPKGSTRGRIFAIFEEIPL
jgi:sortase (surface protein transpeptidase)